MKTILVSSEITCGIFMLFILIGLHWGTTRKNRTARAYRGFVIAETIGIFSDAFSYLLDEIPGMLPFAIPVTTFSYLMTDACLVLFTLYMTFLISEKKKVKFMAFRIVCFFSSIDACMIIIGVFTKNLFDYNDGTFNLGPWNEFVGVIPAIEIVFLYVLLFFEINKIGKKYILILCTFMVFPSLELIFLFIFPNYSFSYISGAFSCVIIYIFIQSRLIAESNARERVLSEMSYLDELTGLKNRRAFDASLPKARNHSEVGVVFCDLNELKYTNDHLGHEAGDTYIKHFAQILCDVFTNDRIYRIGGDEFVVIIYDISFAQMEIVMKEFSNKIRKNERIACFGYSHGEGKEVEEHIHKAEQNMYLDKANYYAQTGHERRK